MAILGFLLTSLAGLLNILLQLAILLFIVRAVLSWFDLDTRQPVIGFIYAITDPVLNRLRRLIPPVGGVDLSPVVAILVCYFLKSFLVSSLEFMAHQLIRSQLLR